MWVKYKRCPINVLYSLGSKNDELSLSKREHDGFMGEVTGLQANKPLSEIRSTHYFHWLKTIPEYEQLISKPKKYQRLPRSLILNELWRWVLVHWILQNNML